MATTIAEFFLRRWASENVPGAKVEIEGRAAKLTDKNGDTLCIAYDSETKSIVCLSTCNMDNP